MTLFRPAFGLANAHAQTIWPSKFRRVKHLPVVQAAWPRPQGGVVDMVLRPYKTSCPGVLLLHGLEGSARSNYLRGMMSAVDQAGYNVAALEFHSCGPSPPSSPQLYHSGRTDEIAFAISQLRTLWKGAPLAACGFSLGGNALLKYLGETGDDAPLVAAVAISVPFDLAACARSLDGPGFFAKTYRNYFLKSLRRKAIEVAQRFSVPFSEEQVNACRTLRAFDDLVTAPLFGFASAEDYWARNSSAGFLAGIRRPALLLSAADDPFIPKSAIPRDVIAANPRLQLLLSHQGGHAGFLHGPPWRLRYWSESAALTFLQQKLGV
ncbi:MAG: alpha/beta fold hydrolase [Deltaproteobacteria bacterium]|nr:alpha/beta fold hydrolase [Deltaproteobacteria bacterium]